MPSRPYRFLIVDVFADKPFGGNPLAVLPKADGLTPDLMQAIAREFNFAESIFIEGPGTNCNSFRARIFTPRVEIPFAGHPTLGAAAVLASQGSYAPGTECDLFLEEQVGVIPVRITAQEAGATCRMRIDVSTARMDHGVDLNAAAAAIDLDRRLVNRGFRASLGLPFTFLELADPAAVDTASLVEPAWRSMVRDSWAKQLFLYAFEPSAPGAVYARMFAPALGIAEDPATGSAAAALAFYFGSASAEDDYQPRLVIRQGVQMRRPSVIRTSVIDESDSASAIEVEGDAVIVASGTINVPI